MEKYADKNNLRETSFCLIVPEEHSVSGQGRHSSRQEKHGGRPAAEVSQLSHLGSRGVRGKWESFQTWNSCSPVRLHLLKVPQPSKSVPLSGDLMFIHMGL